MRDFTLKTYRLLLETFLQAGYRFQTFEEFMEHSADGKTVVLRHDVDEKPYNALEMARLEHELGVKATYFFRIVKQSNVPEVIREIASMGHEIGYHYEDLVLEEGDEEKALASFAKNLAYFRQFYPVKTVCMHGSSTSKYDNRLLWKDHQLADFGLIGEPYLTVDFNEVYYLTDTGYAWDGGKYAVRDVVENHFGLTFHATPQIMDCIRCDAFPKRAMILAHTLWTDNMRQWYWLHWREFLRNNIKKMAKHNKVIAFFYNRLVKMYWK